RGVAPRDRVDDPPRGRLPPAARPGGLTSPDTGQHSPNGPPRPPAPVPRTRKITHKPQPRRPARPPCPDSPGETPRAKIGPEMIYRNSSVDSGLGTRRPLHTT